MRICGFCFDLVSQGDGSSDARSLFAVRMQTRIDDKMKRWCLWRENLVTLLGILRNYF